MLPHGYSLCSDGPGDLGTLWETSRGEADQATSAQEVDIISFSADGTVTDLEGTTVGTWEYDGTDTVMVRFDESSAPSGMGASELSLRVGEVVRACGEVDDDVRDSLVSERPSITFEPAVC